MFPGRPAAAAPDHSVRRIFSIALPRASSTMLKTRDDEGTVLVHGGPDFAKSLTRLGLVDEYQLTTVPIAIGAGRSPFAELEEHLKLDVVEEERFQSGALAQILVPKP